MSKKGIRNIKWQISDPFLRFWFRYVYPFQNLIESNQMGLLREHIETDYPQFTGKTLEHYFQAKAMQSGRYTMIGNWWDRRGENEIDIVALNEFDKTGMVAEIKRNGKKLDAAALDKKILMLPPEFSLYRLKASLLCMDDM